MSSKLTELTESSPSAPPPSVLCGSGVFTLHGPSGHFDPSQKYDGYKARPCRRTRVPTSNVRRYLWSREDGPFGKEFPVSEAPTPDGTSGYSHFPISKINTEGVVKRIRRIADSPTDPDAEGSNELDGEEVEVVPHSFGHQSSTSSPQHLSNRFQSQVIPSTPRAFQPVLASIPPASPSSSHTRPALTQAVRPSPIQKPRNPPINTSQQLQPMARSSRRRDGLSPLPFPAVQVFQRRDRWPIRITREDPNMASENQEAVARLFRRVDRNSREVIMYENDRTILGTASEEMAAKFAWNEAELINGVQQSFEDLGRDN
ncbi:hypothetical protein O181_030323 [Austropuccinia psidii MF-1]|uniref:Uncharacterized protein n=1 Tax=Austropuccinia psidii MF-1 TaxID=1389203 RepID=A0A9Q3CVC2_9BASI|nr:hypothetical protein [Austropuccinia psidii MF-1]